MAFGTTKVKEVIAAIDKHIGTDWKLGTAAEVITDVNAAAAIAMTGTLSVAGIMTALLGFVELPEITTPTAIPDSGAFYTKADNKPYFQDGAGTEHEVIKDDAGTVTIPAILAATGAITGTTITGTGIIKGTNAVASAAAPGANTESLALFGQKDSTVQSKASFDLETEELVVTESITIDTTVVVWWNGVQYKIGLEAV